MHMSVSSNSYSVRTPEPGKAQEYATPPIASAVQPAGDAVPQKPSPAMDVVIFWGPRQFREDLDAVTNAARRAGLKFRVVEIASYGSLSSQLKADLYLDGQLGPNTQVIANFAINDTWGSQDPYLALSESDQQQMPAFDFISWLRTPPRGMPPGPLPTSWLGTVHAFWPHSGMLRDRFAPDKPCWKVGTMFTYSARKGDSDDNSVAMMLDLCDYLGSAKDEPALLAPEYVAARMLGVAGDTFACFGGNFEQAVVVGAPRMPEQARQDYLLATLEGKNGEQERVVGAGRDLLALASAMRHPRVIGEASRRQQTKFENVYAVRASREKLLAVEALLAEQPRLRNFRSLAGVDGESLYRRVATANAIERAMDSLLTGTGGITVLESVLTNMHLLRSMGITFSLNLAGAIARRPHLVARALEWTVLHGYMDIFMHLWPALLSSARQDVMTKCLQLALESRPRVAMALLGMLHPGTSLAERMALGLHGGASYGTALAWVTELDWLQGNESAAQVLEGLAQTEWFFRLLSELARAFPGRFALLLASMRENPVRCEPYAQALLQHARQNRDTTLNRQILQGYFQIEDDNEANRARAV